MCDNYVTIHQSSIQILALEMFNTTPDIMNDNFSLNAQTNYDLSRLKEFYTRSVKTIDYGTKSIGF